MGMSQAADRESAFVRDRSGGRPARQLLSGARLAGLYKMMDVPPA